MKYIQQKKIDVRILVKPPYSSGKETLITARLGDLEKMHYTLKSNSNNLKREFT